MDNEVPKVQTNQAGYSGHHWTTASEYTWIIELKDKVTHRQKVYDNASFN